jgi:hypothetical protein
MLAQGLPFLRNAALLALALSPLASASPSATDQELFRAAAETNVNQRYTIESVSVGGVRFDDAKLPSHLRARIRQLIGAHCDAAVLDDLAADLRKELHLRTVSQRLLKGTVPDRVRVDFEVVRKTIDISVPRFLFHSRQGVTGEVDASAHLGQNTFTVGAVSNGDNLVERFTGIVARYEDNKVVSDRIHFGVAFEDFHEQWNVQTRDALASESAGTPGLNLYRARTNVAPEFTFALARPLTVSVGASFEYMDPENRADSNRMANALTGEVHYGHKIEDDSFGSLPVTQLIDARYNFRAGTRSLGSDYSYSRHMLSFRYEIKSGRQTASDELMAGSVAGIAPMFERFVLGSDSTLRGWDRYAIDPIGGNRMVHNSLTYGYQFGERTAEVFYDSGALWNAGRSAQIRHSVGVSFRQGIFVLTTAFPVVEGRIQPVFMAGMNY